MKKFFAMLLVVVALGGFTIGCGGAAESPAAPESETGAPEDAGAEDAGAEDAGAEEAAE